MFLKLIALWQTIAPFIEAANVPAAITAFEKAITDFNGKNYAAVLADLQAALLALVPSAAAPVLASACKP